MSALFGRPQMLPTRTPGLKVGWKQGLHERTGFGTLWLDHLGEVETELSPCPKMYFNQLRTVPNPEELANQLIYCYKGNGS